MAWQRDPRALFPPDLARLEVVERQLHALLVEVRTLIAEAHRDRRLAESPHLPVPQVEWRIQYDIGRARRPVMVHLGDCTLGSSRSRPATREQADASRRSTPTSSTGSRRQGTKAGSARSPRSKPLWPPPPRSWRPCATVRPSRPPSTSACPTSAVALVALLRSCDRYGRASRARWSVMTRLPILTTGFPSRPGRGRRRTASR
ncbi:DUF6233 domain-containing protein [Streptomyces sp. NPDC054904]